MRNFRYRRRLPGQTVIPSQRASPRVPLASGPLDTRYLSDNEMRGPSGQPKADPFVITHYDARPINCVDFVKTFTSAEQTALNDAQLATFAYEVPDSRVAVIRYLDLVVYATGDGGGAVEPRSVIGIPQVAITASFLINGNPVEQFSNVRVDDASSQLITAGAGFFVWVPGKVHVPTYFLAPPSSTLSLVLTLPNVNTAFRFVQPVFGGQLLMAKQVNPDSEPGTHAPIPMQYGFNGGR